MSMGKADDHWPYPAAPLAGPRSTRDGRTSLPLDEVKPAIFPYADGHAVGLEVKATTSVLSHSEQLSSGRSNQNHALVRFDNAPVARYRQRRRMSLSASSSNSLSTPSDIACQRARSEPVAGHAMGQQDSRRSHDINTYHGPSNEEGLKLSLPTAELDPMRLASSSSVSPLEDDRRGAQALDLTAFDIQPSPPRRNLRTRKPAQLAPYTTEMQRYKRRLIRNDWADAVVMEREFLRAQRERRREHERAAAMGVELEPTDKRPESSLTEFPTKSGAREGDRNALDKRKKALPLRERRNEHALMERYGGLIESSSDTDDRGEGTSNRMSPAISVTPASSLSSVIVPRKRHRQPFLSESSDISDAEDQILQDVRNGSDERATIERDRQMEGTISVIDVDAITSERDRIYASLTSKEIKIYRRTLKQALKTMPMMFAKDAALDVIIMLREKYSLRGRRSVSHGEDNVSEGTDEMNETVVPEELRPGESRTRLGAPRDREDGRLIDDADEESDDSAMADYVSISDSSETEMGDSSEDDVEVDGSIRQERWSHPKQRRRRDDIDKLLMSAHPKTKRRPKQNTQPRLLESRRVLGGRYQGSSVGSAERRHASKKQKQSAHRPRIARAPYQGRTLLQNPPIADVPSRPRVSLLLDSALFNDTEPSVGTSEEPTVPVSSPLYTPTRDKVPLSGQASALSNQGLSRSTAASPTSPTKIDLRAADRGFSVSPTKAIAPLYAAGSKPQGPLKQRRLELPLQSSADVSPPSPQVLKQQIEMDVWQDLVDLRLDFGITPPRFGLAFRVDSFLGRGRLFELLQLSTDVQQHVQLRPMNIFGVELSVSTFTPDHFKDATTIAKQQLRLQSTKDTPHDSEAKLTLSLLDLLRFALQWTTFTERDERLVWDVLQCLRDSIDELLAIVNEGKRSGKAGQYSAGQYSSLVQSLRWCKVEMAWREGLRTTRRRHSDHNNTILTESESGDWQDDFPQAAQELMLELLVHGLNHTTLQIKRGNEGFAGSTETQTDLDDQSAQYWIFLLHLLSSPICAHLFGPSCSFWHIYELATKQYQTALLQRKSKVIVAENGWYCLLAVSSLSYFSAAMGVATSRSCLPNGYWPIIMRLITLPMLRADIEVESAMPHSAVRVRDAYIRLLLSRVMLLHKTYNWTFEGSETTLGRLFALFDGHKLEDLPSETMHDFPVFLRSYDSKLLLEPFDRNDTAFHLFLKLLAHAAKDYRLAGSGDNMQAERSVARLFSRFSPVRTMNFSKHSPPTTLQRSALYNHYSIAIVYLFLVPSSHHQRLLQIQQYLSFSKADDKSQLICIRAMMYAILVLQHHHLDIDEAVSWFKRAFKMLVSRLEEQHRVGPASGQLLRWERDVKTNETLLVAALRSVQHVVLATNLEPGKKGSDYPSLLLVDAIWTADLLESQLAVQDVQLASEICNLLQTFLIRRREAIECCVTQNDRTALEKNPLSEESQDSCADLFDDIDFDDALLLDAAGYGDLDEHLHASVSREHIIRGLDKEFAQLLHSKISPAMFRLISNLLHSGRDKSFALSSSARDARSKIEERQGSLLHPRSNGTRKAALTGLLIDTWSWSAWVMVEDNSVRSWSCYFSYGPEDPKRLSGDVTKRDVNLRFLVMVTSKCLAKDAPRRSLQVYEANMGEIWNAFLSSFAASRTTSQHLLCNNLRQLEHERMNKIQGFVEREGNGSLLDGVDWHGASSWTAQDFLQFRLQILAKLFANFSSSFSAGKFGPGFFYGALTSLLVSLRAYVAEVKDEQPGSTNADYLDLCGTIVQQCHLQLNDALQKGIAAELNKAVDCLSP